MIRNGRGQEGGACEDRAMNQIEVGSGGTRLLVRTFRSSTTYLCIERTQHGSAAYILEAVSDSCDPTGLIGCHGLLALPS